MSDPQAAPEQEPASAEPGQTPPRPDPASVESAQPGPERTAPHGDPLVDGEWHPFHPDSVTVGRIVAYLTLLSIVAILLTVLTVVRFSVPLSGALPAFLYAAILSLAALFAALAWTLPALEHRHARYRIDASGITIREGVLFRTVTSVPRARVQHTDVKRGPLQRRYGLATLVIHTAGTQDASVTVSGLPEERAPLIRDYLIEGGDGGV